MPNERNHHQGRVIVGVNHHERGVAALRYAAEEASRRNAVLVAVTVWSPYGGDIVERTYPCPELDTSYKATAQNILDTACEHAGLPDDLTVEHRVERGLLGPVLADLAHRPHDLLVIAQHHRQAFARLRPAADRYCLQHATAPVLIIPPDWTSTTTHPSVAA
ncbi:universal stress protein [Streptomyces sp. NPDC101151]|uniref:universal stress protein n=1 Tax=Streptomyces sp. NPDC101151 TaxID=3366115 RepID=UPI0038281FCD